MAYTYARRVALAKERGFADPRGKVNAYTYYRRSMEFANSSPMFLKATGLQRAGIGEFTKRPYVIQEARDYYEAFALSDEDDYSVHMRNGHPTIVYDEDGKPRGAKAKVLIEMGLVPSAAAWRRLYPTRTRFGHLLETPPKVKRRARPPGPKVRKRTKYPTRKRTTKPKMRAGRVIRARKRR
jgi:hypothetical protein